MSSTNPTTTTTASLTQIVTFRISGLVCLNNLLTSTLPPNTDCSQLKVTCLKSDPLRKKPYCNIPAQGNGNASPKNNGTLTALHCCCCTELTFLERSLMALHHGFGQLRVQLSHSNNCSKTSCKPVGSKM
eukprot:6479038-Amphidinium_carterae.1